MNLRDLTPDEDRRAKRDMDRAAKATRRVMASLPDPLRFHLWRDGERDLRLQAATTFKHYLLAALEAAFPGVPVTLTTAKPGQPHSVGFAVNAESPEEMDELGAIFEQIGEAIVRGVSDELREALPPLREPEDLDLAEMLAYQSDRDLGEPCERAWTFPETEVLL